MRVSTEEDTSSSFKGWSVIRRNTPPVEKAFSQRPDEVDPIILPDVPGLYAKKCKDVQHCYRCSKVHISPKSCHHKIRYADWGKLWKCWQIMRRMYNAIAEQKNVLIDVKNGLKKLEQAVHTITFSRTSWRGNSEDHFWRDLGKKFYCRQQEVGEDVKKGGIIAKWNMIPTKQQNLNSIWMKNRQVKEMEAWKERAAAKAAKTRSGGMAIMETYRAKRRARGKKGREGRCKRNCVLSRSHADVLGEIRCKAKLKETLTEIIKSQSGISS